MITIERLEIANIPVLSVVKASERTSALPTVFYYHGFNGEKESSLTLAYKMAEKGLRVILPDAPLHGERAKSTSPIEHGVVFWEIVTGAIQEIDKIYNKVQAEGLILEDRVGFAGTSMGGMITYAALTTYDWIKAAGVLMGTPYLSQRAKRTMEQAGELDRQCLEKVEALDLTKNLERLNERPLFIWHGEKDQIVPVEDSRRFYQELQPEYNPENLVFIEEKERIHQISKLSIRKTAEWFASKL